MPTTTNLGETGDMICDLFLLGRREEAFQLMREAICSQAEVTITDNHITNVLPVQLGLRDLPVTGFQFLLDGCIIESDEPRPWPIVIEQFDDGVIRMMIRDVHIRVG